MLLRWMYLGLASLMLPSVVSAQGAHGPFTREYNLEELAELADLSPQELDAVVAEIERDVMPDTWKAKGGEGMLALKLRPATRLVVRQTRDAHEEIADWIEQRVRLAEREAIERRAVLARERQQRAQRRAPTSTADLARTGVCVHLDTPLAEGRNLVFGVVTQLAWQSLKSEIAAPVKLAGGQGLARLLNQADPAAARLDPSCYVAVAGKGPAAVERLRRSLAEKFPGKAGAVIVPSDENTVLLYAYLFRQLPFAHWFERQKAALSFRATYGVEPVESFGIADFSSSNSLHDKLREQVTVLDHQSDDDFVIQLHAAGYEDELILAKVARQPTLARTIDAVRSRIAKRAAKTRLKRLIAHESVIIPVIDFNLIDSSSAIRNTEILNRGWEGTRIGAQTTRIQFRLDEMGAVVEMEEELEALSALPPPPPRHFVFDRPFLVYLAMPGAEVPYFAAWIENSEVLERHTRHTSSATSPMSASVDQPMR